MFFNLVKSRRSIREYKNLPVKEEDLRQILEAAMFAPSALNRQPWHFIVIRDRELLLDMKRACPNMKMLDTAPCAVVVCGDTNITDEGYCITDCCAAIENILLAAKSLGYGSCWCGIYPREERMNIIRKMLSIPDDVMPIATIALGISDEEKAEPQRFDEKRIHNGKW